MVGVRVGDPHVVPRDGDAGGGRNPVQHLHLLARDAGEKARLLADLALPALRQLNRDGALLPAA